MAMLGIGGKLQIDLSGVYTDIAEVTAIGGPQITVADVDVTHLLSANQFKEFLAGWGDGGVLQCEANFTPAQLATLYGQIRVTKAWRMLFSNGSKWDFNGHLNALNTDNPLEEEVSMPFSIKITGKPVFTQ